MSLVDYADSSSDQDDDTDKETEAAAAAAEEEIKEQQQEEEMPPVAPPSRRPSAGVSPLPPPMIERLPDASLLLASPSFSSHQTVGTDHSSRVAAAMAASESRKRHPNGSGFPSTRSKLPRGQLPHSRNVPDTNLIPPQLRGRSNVVTEDISKLFVRRDGQNLRDGN
ncbi:uncharacterized protein M6B38_255410 [Iris pallida]|uniref:Uncharacterized protein n=1 Tax=Iris pallida TaxID=29817 RepID=A0AAX6IH77_IRIPA|nr:uncharacterized protein M6B38_255410 [Iris pallida]